MMLQFRTVDVFTDRQFGGNPLAVVLNAEGLDGVAMQRIANEFNLSETTFVLPPDDPANTARVRIFTPRAELPFAGHPNVGTAFVLATIGDSYGKPISGPLMFEEIAGLVRVETLAKDGAINGAMLTAPKPFARGDDLSVALVAEACSLQPEDIESARHAPCYISCGEALVAVELRSLDALAAAAPRVEAFVGPLGPEVSVGVHLYVRCEGGEVDVRTRMFAPAHGIPEDPATGAANVALVGHLAALAPEADLALDIVIGQGFEMGRPSILHAKAHKENGRVTECRIGGQCVAMQEGTLRLD